MKLKCFYRPVQTLTDAIIGAILISYILAFIHAMYVKATMHMWQSGQIV